MSHMPIQKKIKSSVSSPVHVIAGTWHCRVRSYNNLNARLLQFSNLEIKHPFRT